MEKEDPVTEKSDSLKFKILVDINQLWGEELPDVERLKCDGVWAIINNCNSGESQITVTDAMWKEAFKTLGPGELFTEDYWVSEHNYENVKRILGGDSDIVMPLYYAETSMANDCNIHTSTVICDSIINLKYLKADGKRIMVLSRSFTNENHKKDLIRAIRNDYVGGGTFEVWPTDAIASDQFITGVNYILKRGRKAFLLLPPPRPSGNPSNINYTKQIKDLYNYLLKYSDLLKNSNFYLVPAVYNRKTETNPIDMFNTEKGDNSVENAIKKLIELRKKYNDNLSE